MAVVPWTERTDSGGLGARLTIVSGCWAMRGYQHDQAGNDPGERKLPGTLFPRRQKFWVLRIQFDDAVEVVSIAGPKFTGKIDLARISGDLHDFHPFPEVNGEFQPISAVHQST